MDSQGLVSRFRKDMADETAPFLWSDEEVYGYADEAQRTLVREIGGIKDATSSIAQLAVSVNAKSVKFADVILKIKTAYKLSDGREISVINVDDMPGLGIKFDGSTGPLRYLIIGMDDTQAFFHPIPNVADTLQCVIERLPRYTITVDQAPQALEVPEKHHMKLLDGMKAQAYNKQDAETFDKRKAEEFEGLFARYCAKAKAERARREHKPRTVAYGGISMGTRAETDYGRSR